MKFIRLLSKRQTFINKQKINGYFLVVEYVVHVKQVMKRHKNNRVNQTLLVQKAFHLEICMIITHIFIHLNLVKLLFSVPKSVSVLVEVPVGEVVLEVEL